VLLELVVIFGSLFAVALWEFCGPRRSREFPALRRRVGNLGFWLINLFLAAFFFPRAASIRPQIEAFSGVRLLVWPLTNAAVSLVAGFLLLDLMRYLVHRCEHAVPLFWRFHALHHSNPDVDVTTSVRHHPLEYLLASMVYWLAVIVLDIPTIVVMTHGLAPSGRAYGGGISTRTRARIPASLPPSWPHYRRPILQGRSVPVRCCGGASSPASRR
jgi:sterol desaturase/sphingolipid hydroxylase (fatty acid hydroxylase superfamily)